MYIGFCKQYNAEKNRNLSAHRLQMEGLGTRTINLRCDRVCHASYEKTKEFRSLVDIAFDEDGRISRLKARVKLA